MRTYDRRGMVGGDALTNAMILAGGQDPWTGQRRETRREEEARLAREAIDRNNQRAEALERPNRRRQE